MVHNMVVMTSSCSSLPAGAPPLLLPPSDDEIRSLIRVRNRLAQSADERLPTILTGLLPKLFLRIDQYSKFSILQESSSSSTVINHQQGTQNNVKVALSHLNGILGTSLERVRGNASLDVRPWIESIAPSLDASNPVSASWVLSFLQVGIPRCCATQNQTLPSPAVFSSLCRFVDALHSKLRQRPSSSSEDYDNHYSKAAEIQLMSSSWILLDAFCISVGVTPMVDWDLDCMDDDGNKNTALQAQQFDAWEPIFPDDSSSVVEEFLTTNTASGVFNLILDVLLYWPTHSDPHRVGERSGISDLGEARMNFRRTTQQAQGQQQQWTDMALVYLRKMKLATLRVAVWPLGRGLFRDSNLLSDYALVLCAIVLPSPQQNHHSSMHNRLAADYIKKHDLLHSKGISRVNATFCSIEVAISLVTLIVGDVGGRNSTSTTEQVDQMRQNGCLEAILPSLSGNEQTRRPRLSTAAGSSVVAFLVDRQLVLESSSSGGGGGPNEEERRKLKYLLDLIMSMAELHSDAKHWAIQLVNTYYTQLRDSFLATADSLWYQSFLASCFKLCCLALQVVVEVGETHSELERQPQNTPPLPLGVPAPFQHRPDLNRLLNNHRTALIKKHLGNDEAILIRQKAYHMLKAIVPKLATPPPPPLEGTFDLPILLFKCSTFEHERLQADVSNVLDCVLDCLKKQLFAPQHTHDSKSDLFRVAPILPCLLEGVCSENISTRTSSVKWIRDIVLVLDPPAAYHLCSFLRDEGDPIINKMVVTVNDDRESKEAFVDDDSIVEPPTLVNIKVNGEIHRILESAITSLMSEFTITQGEASILLEHYNFSSETARSKLRSNRVDALVECGLRDDTTIVANNEDPNTNSGVACEICYDELDGVKGHFSLQCCHRFCRGCWVSYLESTFSLGQYQTIRVTCPHHNCQQRIPPEDLILIAPSFASKWKESLFDMFLERSKDVCRCPGPQCTGTMVAVSGTPMAQNLAICCSYCETSFCLYCGESPHIPAKCCDFASWNKIFGSSSFWIKKNSKPCPGCNVPIEKNQGCNHMTCERCTTQFCWVCLTVLRQHSESHTCNRYDPAANAEDDGERRALFVTDRFKAHDEAEVFARSHLRRIQSTEDYLVNMFWFVTPENERVLKSAIETLCQTRQFLKHSYVAAYGMRQEPVEKVRAFESHQVALEILCERLSQLTERNLHPLYLEQGGLGIRHQFRVLAFYSTTCANYMARFLSFVTSRAIQD